MKRKKDDELKVGASKEGVDSMNSISKRTGQSISNPSAGREVSRRCFTNGISRFIGLSVLSHFSLLGNNAFGNGDTGSGSDCPGGGDDSDECSAKDPDYCPSGGSDEDHCGENSSNDTCAGEAPPGDVCPEGTNTQNTADKCDSGLEANDICNPTRSLSDQCYSGLDPDDACPADGGINYTDNCPGGAAPQDWCPSDGGMLQDECPGGGTDVDTCEPSGAGDECSIDDSDPLFGSDKCHNTDPQSFDSCIDFSDDNCPNGTNTTLGTGGDDICGPILGIGIFGSDVCIDGSPAQDRCENDGSHDFDTCPGGGTNVDTCDPSTATAADICPDGFPTTDECKPSVGDNDECPGGDWMQDSCNPPSDPDECPGGQFYPVDECPTGAAPEDECTAAGGCAGGDQESFFPTPDTVIPPPPAE